VGTNAPARRHKVDLLVGDESFFNICAHAGYCSRSYVRGLYLQKHSDAKVRQGLIVRYRVSISRGFAPYL
jgi:hypothetical protein